MNEQKKLLNHEIEDIAKGYHKKSDTIMSYFNLKIDGLVANEERTVSEDNKLERYLQAREAIQKDLDNLEKTIEVEVELDAKIPEFAVDSIEPLVAQSEKIMSKIADAKNREECESLRENLIENIKDITNMRATSPDDGRFPELELRFQNIKKDVGVRLKEIRSNELQKSVRKSKRKGAKNDSKQYASKNKSKSATLKTGSSVEGEHKIKPQVHERKGYHYKISHTIESYCIISYYLAILNGTNEVLS